MRLRTKEFQMRVVVAEIEDEGILGMDFLSQVDSQASNNGEVIDCSNFKSRPFSSRCVVRQ